MEEVHVAESQLPKPPVGKPEPAVAAAATDGKAPKPPSPPEPVGKPADAAAAATPPDPLVVRVSELEIKLASESVVKRKFQRLVEEACLDALQAVLVKYGCTISVMANGMVEVKAGD